MAEEGKHTSFDLVSGIIEEAEKEAQALIEKAKKEADQRVASSQKQAESLMSRQEKEIERRKAEIEKDNERRISMEIRRLVLKEQERLFDAVHAEARRRMKDAMNEKGYKRVLEGWILEAAMGLECKKAVVLTSAEEAGHIDESLLTKVTERIFKLTGRRVELSLDPERPQSAQGILLAEEGGGRIFNNQVSTRLIRYKSAVRTAIHKELFTEL